MPWASDTEYHYTKKVLDAIALGYDAIYSQGIDMGIHVVTEQDRVIEFKADFDLALSSIGKGYWWGLADCEFKAYRDYGKLQRVVIARILGVSDWELQPYGFYRVAQLRGLAYHNMCAFLNGNDTAIMKAREERWLT